MRRYETIIIIDPDIESNEESEASERLVNLISDQSGLFIKAERWGSRKLAYEIRKKLNGVYILIDYCGIGALVNEIERFCRIDERILKYMTVMIDREPDIESIKEKMKEAEEAEMSKSDELPSEGEPAEEDADAGKATSADETYEESPADETEQTETEEENDDKDKEEE